MNKIWFFMILLSLVTLSVVNPSAVMSEMISASGQALKLCFELAAVYAVWLGILELVEASGLSQKLAKALSPIIKKLFNVENQEIQKMIALNMSANMLGLGNASTPMGIKAMRALDDGSGIATDAMIMLIVLNATSIQLLPSTVIGLRAAAGSAAPADIVLPTLFATIVTSLLGVLLVKLCSALRARRKK